MAETREAMMWLWIVYATAGSVVTLLTVLLLYLIAVSIYSWFIPKD